MAQGKYEFISVETMEESSPRRIYFVVVEFSTGSVDACRMSTISSLSPEQSLLGYSTSSIVLQAEG